MAKINLSDFEQIIIDAAKHLLEINDKTTTKEIKEYCRNNNSTYKYYQEDVSDVMANLASDYISNLSFKDNGVYREYFVNKKEIILTKSEIIGKIIQNIKSTSNNVSKFTITFNKKSNEIRTLDCYIKYPIMDNLGYIKALIYTNSGVENRLIDPRKIISVKIGNILYKAK